MQNQFATMNDNQFDPSAKVKPPYSHQEYPKMVYSKDFDPALDKRIREITQHNATLRDPMQCREVPARVRLTRIVGNKREESEALKDGWMLKPVVEEEAVAS